MAMQEIKSFKIVPSCIVIACVWGVLAVLEGIGLFLGGLVHGHVGIGLYGLIVRPLIFFAPAVLMSALAIWVYNAIAPQIGGIQIEVGDAKE
ncbi:MAG TPA: hypothetical protein VMU16_13205 [Candidatus Binataceae bacterium]|nr:hypothetical protein [Candidatus Binataceae bacterium]